MGPEMYMIAAVLSGVSFIAGFVDSIAGGGGLILLPAVLLSGLPPQMALGTNKFASSIGTASSLYNFVKNKKVLWPVAKAGIIFTLLGAFAGSRIILLFSNQVIGKIIVFLLPVAMVVTLVPRKQKEAAAGEELSDYTVKVPLICFLLGFYDGFFGPGAGSFLIIALYLFIGLNLVHASATAKVFNLTSNIGALIVFLINGKVIILLGLPLALANMAGNYLGSSLVIKKGSKLVKVFLVVSLTVLFISLLYKYIL